MRFWFDGGARPNPGEMEIAVVVEDPWTVYRQRIGHGTNNLAEWTAFIWGLEIAANAGATRVQIEGDSALVVNQANGLWKVSNPSLRSFHEDFTRLKSSFVSLDIRWIGRDRNPAGLVLEGKMAR